MIMKMVTIYNDDDNEDFDDNDTAIITTINDNDNDIDDDKFRSVQTLFFLD